jgi:glycosyltransferase involved in cell wall biosynthesis
MNNATKVLILTHGAPPSSTAAATGNGLRSWILAAGLRDNGFEVVYSTPRPVIEHEVAVDGIALIPLPDRAEMSEFIDRISPDIVIVGYWELAKWLPECLRAYVVIDLLAPRLLEMWSSDKDINSSVLAYIECLRKGDFFICPSERQKAFHAAFLIQSGMTPPYLPIDVVPIAAASVPSSAAPKPSGAVRLVYGGIDWKWRDASKFLEAVLKGIELSAQGELHIVTGSYPLGGDDEVRPVNIADMSTRPRLRTQNLMPYAQLIKFYSTCHVGLDLTDHNTERELSFSFRVIDYLSAGLPVICNDYVEIAEWIRDYDAGWVIGAAEVDDAQRLVEAICEGAEDVGKKAENARRLVAEKLTPDVALKPLFEFCREPRKWNKDKLVQQAPNVGLVNGIVDCPADESGSLTERDTVAARHSDPILWDAKARLDISSKAAQFFEERTAYLLDQRKRLELHCQSFRSNGAPVTDEWNVLCSEEVVPSGTGSAFSDRRELVGDRLDLRSELLEISRNAERHFESRIQELVATRGKVRVSQSTSITSAAKLTGTLSGFEQGVRRSASQSIRILRKVVKHTLVPLAKRWGSPHIAIVTRHDIFPADHGAAVKILETAKALSRVYEEVYIITGDREKFFVIRNGDISEELFPFVVRERFYHGYHELRRRFVDLGVPGDESYLFFSRFDDNFRLRVLYVAWHKGIDFYVAEFPGYLDSCSWARRAFGGGSAIVEHNVEFQRIAKTYGPPPEGVEFLKRYEVSLCNMADYVIAVSDQDRADLERSGVMSDKITVIPHGVNLRGFDRCDDTTRRLIRRQYSIGESECVLMFHGIYTYRPNRDAVDFLADFVLPAINERGHFPKCLAVGKHPPPTSRHRDLIFTGVVDNVAAYVGAADIGVVPLMDGGGTRMKILEYFAGRVPVVATPKGAEGIPAKGDGTHLFIEDELDGLVDRVVELIEDPGARMALGERGRVLAEQWDWARIGERYAHLFGVRRRNR